MTLRSVVAAAAAAAVLGLAAPASAETIVRFGTEAQKKFEEDYGVREQAYLETLMKRRVERALAAQGLTGSVEVTILDLKPNRPTLQQMSDKPGLSFQSFGIGGAEMEGVLRDATGAERARLTYDWFESDIVDAQFETTWGDASTAFDRFARKLVEQAAGG
jgi:hypothetical protein